MMELEGSGFSALAPSTDEGTLSSVTFPNLTANGRWNVAGVLDEGSPASMRPPGQSGLLTLQLTDQDNECLFNDRGGITLRDLMSQKILGAAKIRMSIPTERDANEEAVDCERLSDWLRSGFRMGWQRTS